MTLLNKIIRGAGYLPHVGSHPGIFVTVVMILATGAAGISHGGLLGFVMGSLFGAVMILPMFIAGCVSRANLSDRLCAKDAASPLS